MPCYHPLLAHQSAPGVKPIIVNQYNQYTQSIAHHYMRLPCGQCIGCRIDRSREDAARCVLEASLYPDNCFITLTFDPQYAKKTLDRRDFPLFMKRLRQKYGPTIRFYHCGEYGADDDNPHHHACLFNHNFADRYLIDMYNNVPLYRSPSLESLWPYGFSTVGDVTFESAAYCARYITKKITGDAAEKHYEGRVPEHTTRSLRPGIGAAWLDKYKKDVYNYDRLIIHSKLKLRPPRYFDKIYDRTDHDSLETLKIGRRAVAERLCTELTPARLAELEFTKKYRINKLKRGLEGSPTKQNLTESEQLSEYYKQLKNRMDG